LIVITRTCTNTLPVTFSFQVNASHCMLDFINTHFMTFTLYVAMGIEASGLLHASYLIQIIVGKLAGKPIESNEPPRNGFEIILFWGRVVLSTAILIFALVVTIVALFTGRTTMWKGIPPVVSFFLTLLLWSVVGMLEGMQIAFFAVSKLSEEERSRSPWAKRTCDVLFQGDGRNLPGFMIGRQLCVVSCFFFAARATTMSIADGEDNIFNVPNPVQEFFNTGLLGALITTIIASIMWQLVASAFPLAFLSTPITYVLLRLCLVLEFTGICNGAWVIASLHKQFAGFQKDEFYVGTAEDRAGGKALPDVESITGFRSHVGHLTGGAYPAGHELPIPDQWELRFMNRRAQVLSNIKTLHELIKVALSDQEKATYVLALSQEVSALDRINKEHGAINRAYDKQTYANASDDDEEAPVTEIDVTSPGGGGEDEDDILDSTNRTQI
jgi:hypothetical protein